MYGYTNEDAAWQRLIDIQREMENSRLWANRSGNALATLERLAERAWILAGLAARRAPRRRATAPKSKTAAAGRRLDLPRLGPDHRTPAQD